MIPVEVDDWRRGGVLRAPEERTERMVSAYVHDDMTLEQIGAYHGITRERVRQLVSAFDPTLYRLAIRRRRARSRLRNFIRDGRGTRTVECVVCGDPFEVAGDSPGRHCSPVHRQVALVLRYHTDEDHRDRQLRATARWHAEHLPEGHQRRHAQKLLNGEPTEDHGRWLIHGSLPMHWAIRAYVLDWPIFDRLHPDVQEQVRGIVAGKAAS